MIRFPTGEDAKSEFGSRMEAWMQILGMSNWRLQVEESDELDEEDGVVATAQCGPSSLEVYVEVCPALADGTLPLHEVERVACHEALHAALSKFTGLWMDFLTLHTTDTKMAQMVGRQSQQLEDEAVEAISRAFMACLASARAQKAESN